MVSKSTWNLGVGSCRSPGIVGLPNVGKSTLFNALCDTGEAMVQHRNMFRHVATPFSKPSSKAFCFSLSSIYLSEATVCGSK